MGKILLVVQAHTGMVLSLACLYRQTDAVDSSLAELVLYSLVVAGPCTACSKKIVGGLTNPRVVACSICSGL